MVKHVNSIKYIVENKLRKTFLEKLEFCYAYNSLTIESYQIFYWSGIPLYCGAMTVANLVPPAHLLPVPPILGEADQRGPSRPLFEYQNPSSQGAYK